MVSCWQKRESCELGRVGNPPLRESHCKQKGRSIKLRPFRFAFGVELAATFQQLDPDVAWGPDKGDAQSLTQVFGFHGEFGPFGL